MWWSCCSLVLCAGCLGDGLGIPEDAGAMAQVVVVDLGTVDSIPAASNLGPPYCAAGARCLPFSLSQCVCPPDTYCSLMDGCLPSHCGDSVCSPNERCSTCPGDCACVTGQICDGDCVPDRHDGVCRADLDEDCFSPDCPCVGLCAISYWGPYGLCVGDGVCDENKGEYRGFSDDCP
jgi:hypothetical protein